MKLQGFRNRNGGNQKMRIGEYGVAFSGVGEGVGYSWEMHSQSKHCETSQLAKPSPPKGIHALKLLLAHWN